MNHTRAKTRGQRGMTLIEVLVSILIFSFGLVGLAALQARALQYSTSAENTNRASLLATELTGQMTIRNSVNLPAATVQAWQDAVASGPNGLPNGVGSVDTASSANLATIKIEWREPKAPAGSASSQFITSFMVP